MAAELAESLSALTLKEEEASEAEGEYMTVRLKVAGEPAFEVEVEPTAAVRDLKKLAREQSSIEPEHMRLIQKGQLLKDSDVLADCKLDESEPIMIHFTAGHTAMMGGARTTLETQRNPFTHPVRGLPGSKGQRLSRISARHGGMGLIRKYGILLKRQEFREKAEEIGFRKYR